MQAPTATRRHVAHRLPAVADCDRVLVMDGGLVAEVGPPTELLRRSSSRFLRMVRAQGGEALVVELLGES